MAKGCSLKSGQITVIASVLFVTVVLFSACDVPSVDDGLTQTYTVSSFFHKLPDGSEITVFYPRVASGSEHFPIIIFSGGWNLARFSYQETCRGIAGAGYIVISRFYPTLGYFAIGLTLIEEHIAQIQNIIDWCTVENMRSGSLLYDIVDPEEIGLIGHSFGGECTLAAAVADPRIDAAVSLDLSRANEETGFGIVGDIRATKAAVMYIVAGKGGYCSGLLESLEPLFDYTPAPTIEVTINDAGHMDFIERIVDPGLFGYVLCPEGTLAPEYVRAVARRYYIPWFDVYLKGKIAETRYFNGDVSEEDERSGLVAIRKKLSE